MSKIKLIIVTFIKRGGVQCCKEQFDRLVKHTLSMHTHLIAFKSSLSLNYCFHRRNGGGREGPQPIMVHTPPHQQCSSTLLLSPLHAHPDKVKQCLSPLTVCVCVWSYKVNMTKSGVVMKVFLELDMLG